MKNFLFRFTRLLVRMINFSFDHPLFILFFFVGLLAILLKAKPLDVYVTVDTLINKDDEAAKERARQITNDRDVELWHGVNLIETFKATH